MSGGKKMRTQWVAVALLCVVQFMVVLDVAIVNVALPSIQLDLGFSRASLQWVVTAYAVMFGGVLLLGGRLADLLGRRVVFMTGLAVFSLASLLCGLAWSEESLIATRAVQGLGAALITPSALSILTTTFAEGKDRSTALGIWGAVGGVGAAAGVLLGGLLTDLLSWEWIFFVNVPVGAGALALAPFLLAESRNARVLTHDVAGAILVTAGLALLVVGLTQGQHWGWQSRATVGVFAAAVMALVGFARCEVRHAAPLVPLSIFRRQTLTAANVTASVVGSVTVSMFLLLTLYMQEVLGLSALETGAGYLAMAGTAVLWANAAAATVNRVGTKPTLLFGMCTLTLGLLFFTEISADGSYWADLFPGFLVVGIALPFAAVPTTIAALAGTRPHESGLTAGLLNTSQQIGGAIGVALLASIAASTADARTASGAAMPVALTDGFASAFRVAAAIAFAGLLVVALLMRERDLRPFLDVAAETSQ